MAPSDSNTFLHLQLHRDSLIFDSIKEFINVVEFFWTRTWHKFLQTELQFAKTLKDNLVLNGDYYHHWF